MSFQYKVTKHGYQPQITNNLILFGGRTCVLLRHDEVREENERKEGMIQ